MVLFDFKMSVPEIPALTPLDRLENRILSPHNNKKLDL